MSAITHRIDDDEKDKEFSCSSPHLMIFIDYDRYSNELLFSKT